VETFLRCAVYASPAKWFHWLPLAEYWYNTSYQSAIGRAPFEVLYGHPTRHFCICDLTTCSIPDLSDWLKDRQEFTKLLQDHLLRAQQRMKMQMDKNHSDQEFKGGRSCLSESSTICSKIFSSSQLSEVVISLLWFI
jgi:hypothetical protein